ncbi:MAG: hypothetical protein Q4C95_07080 [Planctomycetia bacterium]|nr:hypothetical protein [Planctomycetia bacterium]
MNRTLMGLVALLIGLCVCPSCGGKKYPDGFPKVYPLKVKVIQAGAPLADASINFFAEDATISKWAVGGTTNAEGIAEIRTQNFPGCPAGKFKVVVKKTVQEGGPQNAEEAKQMREGKEFPPVVVREMVSKEFGDHLKTPLSIEVTGSEGNTVPEFDVGDAYEEDISGTLLGS